VTKENEQLVMARVLMSHSTLKVNLWHAVD